MKTSYTRTVFFRFVLACILLSGWTSPVLAQWPSSTTTNLAVSTATGDQGQGFYNKSAIASDGAGGAITCWFNNAAPFEIYAARLNSAGAVQWTTTVCAAISNTPRQNAVVISDGAGGAIVAWQDWRDTTGPPTGNSQNIYAARLNATGGFVWGSGNGTAIATGPTFGNKYFPVMCSDGSNGAILAWTSNISDGGDIFAKHVNASGVTSWGGAGGLVICDTANAQTSPGIVSDGAGGAVIAWEDWRNGSSNRNIFAKRVNASGATVWGSMYGSPVCRFGGNQTAPVMVSDGVNGAVIAWADARGGQAVSAQRVNGSGTMMWLTDGMAVTSSTGAEDVNIATDGASGAYIVWNTNPGLPSGGSGAQNILAQLVGANGTVQWAPTGIPICTQAGTQWRANITSTRNGQAIIAWGDYRGGSYSDIYAQKVDALGNFQWTPGTGVQLTSAACSQGAGRLSIVGDGCDGAILSWQDRRNDGGCVVNDIYAQNLQPDGSLGGVSGNCSAALSISGITSTAVSCLGASDGTATVTPSGGTSPYTFKWSTSPQQTTQTATGLMSGNYTVTVSDASSNSTTATVTVSVSSSVQAGTISSTTSAGGIDSVCQGIPTTLNVSGNSGVVQWQSSANGTSFTSLSGATGTSYVASVAQTTYYRVYVGTGICTDTSPVFKLVVKPLPAPPVLTSGSDTICSGDSTEICAPSTFSAFAWNTGETNRCVYGKLAGGYWVNVTAQNGCAVTSDHLNLNVYPVPSVSIVRQGDTLSSFNAAAYQWYRNGTPILAATSNYLVADEPGAYAVEVTDGNGCKARSSEVLITGIKDISSPADFNIYPNPANSRVYVQYSHSQGEAVRLSLMNGLGEKLIEKYFSDDMPIDISMLPAGMYSIVLHTSQGVLTRKMMKL